jgi:phosphate transport system permease protein
MTKETRKGKKSVSEHQHSGLIDITHKKFRLSDYLAEKIIKSVAYLSIAIVALIFIFVFRESMPIFFSAKQSETKQATTGTGETQEKYGDATENLNSTEVQETYGGETDQPVEPEAQETYGEVTDQSEKQEQYGVQTGEVLMETSQEEVYEVSAGSGHDDNQAALKSLSGTRWLPVSQNPRFGLLSLIIGTFKVTIISILFAAPLAILAALYTASFASKRMKEIIKPTIEMLAGFPSVVIGFFALMVLASFLQNIFGYETRLNSFVGGIAMGIAAIPIIFTITEDALTAVPRTFNEASLALGASKWQTAFFVILPAATPGIFAAVLLGIGRVFGETMIALMATGNAAQMGLNPFESVRTLAATIGAEMAEVVFGDTHYNVLFLIGSLLFIFTFILNAIAEFYVKGKLMKRIQGK